MPAQARGRPTLAGGTQVSRRAVETPPRLPSKWTVSADPADPEQRKAWCEFAAGFLGFSHDVICRVLMLGAYSSREWLSVYLYSVKWTQEIWIFPDCAAGPRPGCVHATARGGGL